MTFWLLSPLLLLLLLPQGSNGNSNQWLQAVYVLCKLCNCNTSMIIKLLSMTLYLQSLYYFGFIICIVEPVSIKVYSDFGNSSLHCWLVSAPYCSQSGRLCFRLDLASHWFFAIKLPRLIASWLQHARWGSLLLCLHVKIIICSTALNRPQVTLDVVSNFPSFTSLHIIKESSSYDFNQLQYCITNLYDHHFGV